jgi:acyl-CoA synthetase (NDP forming)
MSIAHLIRPRSVAIVGASDKIGPGFNAWNALQAVGFSGAVHLVNPSRSELFGRPAYKSLRDIPEPIDAAFVAVGADNVLEVARQAVDQKAGALAILSSGFGEAGETGAAAQDELRRLAANQDIAVCGPNCLGLINFSDRAALFGTSLPDPLPRGGVAAIVQSGSIGIALLNCGRGLGLSHLVTSGNEAVTVAADYLEAVMDDPAVTTIVVFAEQIKQPQRFIAAVRRARTLDKPVIVLKSGRSQRGQAAVQAHTGALAGSVEACDAALRAAGAIQVHSLDELIETAMLVSTGARPKGRGVGAVSLSGGEIALALDAAEQAGIDFVSFEQVRADIAAKLPAFAQVANPLDLTWAGLYDPAVARDCAHLIGGLDEVGSILLLQDAPHGLGAQQATRYAKLLAAVAEGARAAGKPLVAVGNLASAPHAEFSAATAAAGVPYLRGTQEGLAAVARYGAWVEACLPDLRSTSPPARISETREKLEAALCNGPPAEHEARSILAGYGLVGPRERLVQTADEAAAAAGEIGFPAVLKCLAPGLVHKSDLGLVAVGLPSAEAVGERAAAMLEHATRLRRGPVFGLLVQQKVESVAELFVGARLDPEFGPLIAVGAGGVMVELYRDVAVRLAPVSAAEALEAVASTRASQLLKGFRGAPAGDVQAVAASVAAISCFMVDCADLISAVEVNPLAVLPQGQGCVALDCVITPATG